MTCFSNEANSLVKDCKELLQAMPDQSPYDYPTELLSLQGKEKIFQLHFDPESTKEKQLFILDTCWDNTPSITERLATDAEESGTVQPKEHQTTPPTQHTHLPEPSKSTAQPQKKPTRKSLFTENKDAATPPPPKKTRKRN